MRTEHNILEADLARDMGMDREALKRMRRNLLKESIDWFQIPGTGIALTPDAVQKIKEAAPPPVDGAQAGLDVTIVRTGLPNPRAAIGIFQKEGAPSQRVTVICADRRGATTLTPGCVLRGCVPMNPEICTYAGPVPLRRGFPMPEKKEAAV